MTNPTEPASDRLGRIVEDLAAVADDLNDPMAHDHVMLEARTDCTACVVRSHLDSLARFAGDDVAAAQEESKQLRADLQRERAMLVDMTGRFAESDHMLAKWGREIRASRRIIVSLRRLISEHEATSRDMVRVEDLRALSADA